MSNYYIIQDTTLANIANAIRSKTGSTGLMTPLEMPNEIETGGGGLPPDTPWVRPSNYPDLESVVLDSSNPPLEMYLTCDKAYQGTDTAVQIGYVGGTGTITAGHIENNIFIADYPAVATQAYSTAGYNLSDINEDIFVLKIVSSSNQQYTQPVFQSNTSNVIIDGYVNMKNPKRAVKMGGLNNIKHIIYKIYNSEITDMKQIFEGCKSLQSLDLSSFDTSNVTSMHAMFSGCYSLQSLDLSSFDTSNVTDMAYMFSGCYSLQSINLSSFDTHNVTSMGGMFSSCSSLQSINLSSFDTSNVTIMGSMFSSCSSLTSLDLSLFDTSNVTDMDNMFSNCQALIYVKFPTAWKALTMDSNSIFGYGFYRSSFLDFVNALPETSTSITHKFYTPVQYRLTDEDIAIAQNKGYTITFG